MTEKNDGANIFDHLRGFLKEGFEDARDGTETVVGKGRVTGAIVGLQIGGTIGLIGGIPGMVKGGLIGGAIGFAGGQAIADWYASLSNDNKKPDQASPQPKPGDPAP